MKQLLFISVTLLILVTGCRQMAGVKGNGNITSDSRSASGFNSIGVSGNFDVYVKQDSAWSVKIEADDNLLEYIETEVTGGKLKIHSRNGVNIRSSKPLKVYVSAPAYNEFEASGACDFFSENKIITDNNVRIGLSGAGSAKMDIKSPNIRVNLSGAGSVTLSGETRDLSLDGSGSSEFKCFDMLAENVDIDISGAGEATVYASVKLDAKVSGAGSIRYRGNASVNQHISGAGSVKKAD